jgi:hypothetical protein
MFENVVSGLDAAQARVGRDQRELLRRIADADRLKLWQEWGARDTPHFLAMRYDVSEWKARRWIAAAHALEALPLLSEALEAGELGLDKVVELARFATAETEGGLIRWAQRVSCAAVRHRADLAARASIEEVREAERAREVTWWYAEEGSRFRLSADMPAASGPVVIRAIEREAEALPAMPGEEDDHYAEARRADALLALCSARLAGDPDPDRATVVVHARLGGLERGTGGCELEDGPVIHPETVRRLLCNARTQTVVEDAEGTVVGLGRMTREPSPWMIRQIRYRDRGCRFPGCGARRFTEAHHIRWWRHGGRTDLDNLALICSFHHRLVHEHGWSVKREPDGELSWFHPDGRPYRAGPTHRADAVEQVSISAAS